MTSPTRVIVLGSCGAWPEPGRACAGFLVEQAGFRVVLDLGYGTLSRLLAELGSVSAEGLDAVVVTHDHPDHCVDLHALLRARWFGHRGGPAIRLCCPPGVVDRLIELEDGDRAAIDATFRWSPLPGDPLPLGPFRLLSVLLPHHVPNVGVRLETLDGSAATIAYSGDTGMDPRLVELGRDADLFIVDATTRDQSRGSAPGDGLNLRDIEAGRVAAAAGARRLLLTHFWPGNDREASRREAASAYPGPILIADEGLCLDLGDG
jgi:ribonuclease BN (tRNA processing enzyme)